MKTLQESLFNLLYSVFGVKSICILTKNAKLYTELSQGQRLGVGAWAYSAGQGCFLAPSGDRTTGLRGPGPFAGGWLFDHPGTV